MCTAGHLLAIGLIRILQPWRWHSSRDKTAGRRLMMPTNPCSKKAGDLVVRCRADLSSCALPGRERHKGGAA